ncbi:hypothetical protein EMIHUDRAFT_424818 [Emiliania huxleyi CCMP1516]|uniref:Uncharacterized protein n=2 Tax=Emiliania huxleyi TaxID=2903 RepID=A0A0D3J822_EMIH1|nr:hypothetical protein EMIHUDRAFT_424818 [Emiliania huxleyi CCMP1516]EOD19657.1 hypothetical protein EMIHUDRAFT_424818 [Emiliania huxleyi CCMP1516]|eukprot:XP_005772086.1 hypothetical protein EMIHUDRAFT_424818 [Emiliania huxleyi CCMP1516]
MMRYRLAIRPPLSGAAGSAAAEPTYVHDAYSMTQGPNYALAQHMRQWRAMLAYTEGYAVSAPMAPAARTASMLHVHTVATALDGFGYFRPLEAFEPDCLRACLAALLAVELSTPMPALPSPFHLFTRHGFHGGFWRFPYSSDSIGSSAYVLGMVRPWRKEA